jgi:hypothetical protein
VAVEVNMSRILGVLAVALAALLFGGCETAGDIKKDADAERIPAAAAYAANVAVAGSSLGYKTVGGKLVFDDSDVDCRFRATRFEVDPRGDTYRAIGMVTMSTGKVRQGNVPSWACGSKLPRGARVVVGERK